jgi:predicted Zn-dependent protease
MLIEREVAQRLLEVGYYAIGKGHSDKAEKIFVGLAAVRPKSEYPVIALAMLKMNSNRAEEAVKLLKESEVSSATPMGRTYLGLALRLAGLNSESRDVLEQVVNSGENEQAVSLARSLCEEPI